MSSLPITNLSSAYAAAPRQGLRETDGRANDSRQPGASKELTEEERQQVQKLRETDRRVRAHEMAHLAAAGGYARGGAKFEYVRGPDGQMYAVAGEVQIDTSPVPGDPDATIRKMEAVRRAAHAPADPSGQDRAVAAAAAQAIAQAQQEKVRETASTGKDSLEGGCLCGGCRTCSVGRSVDFAA